MGLSPVRAIRVKCLDCSGDQRKEARLCPVKECALWPFRMGTNPNYKLKRAEREKRNRNSDF
jgi:hypothetical protein